MNCRGVILDLSTKESGITLDPSSDRKWHFWTGVILAADFKKKRGHFGDPFTSIWKAHIFVKQAKCSQDHYLCFQKSYKCFWNFGKNWGHFEHLLKKWKLKICWNENVRIPGIVLWCFEAMEINLKGCPKWPHFFLVESLYTLKFLKIVGFLQVIHAKNWLGYLSECPNGFIHWKPVLGCPNTPHPTQVA